jgi:hypothetical protein
MPEVRLVIEVAQNLRLRRSTRKLRFGPERRASHLRARTRTRAAISRTVVPGVATGPNPRGILRSVSCQLLNIGAHRRAQQGSVLCVQSQLLQVRVVLTLRP